MSNIPHPVDLTVKPKVKGFFDEATNTVSYVVQDPTSNACAIIDSVMDIDYAGGRISYESADKIIKYVEENGLKVEWLIETHAHADHLSAAPYIQGKLAGKLGIGENIRIVQDVFGKIFNEGTEFQRDGSQFDRLFKDGDTYTIGNLKAFAILTPGHTPACMTHVIGDAAFVGDTLFMPDGGTARADFPGGDARVLYRSIKRVLELPDSDAIVHVPRLRTRRARDQMGNVGCRGKGHQHSRARGRDRRRIRQDADRTRRLARSPKADHSVDPGKYSRRAAAGSRRERQALPEGAHQRTLMPPRRSRV